jgi:hypothetical protein
MKVILEFDEESEYLLALNGAKYFSCLFQLNEYLYRLKKNGESITIESIHNRFSEILEDNNVNLSEIE